MSELLMAEELEALLSSGYHHNHIAHRLLDEAPRLIAVLRAAESLIARLGPDAFRGWECGHGQPFELPCEDCGGGPVLDLAAALAGT